MTFGISFYQSNLSTVSGPSFGHLVLVNELKTHAVFLLQAKKMAGRAVLMAGSTATFKADTVLLVNVFHTAVSYWLIHPPVGAG